jgi:hypothetical protein
MSSWTRLLGAAALAVLLGACGGRGQGAVGQACTGDSDCQSGLCRDIYDQVAPLACTVTCGATADCPAGLSCGTLADGSRLCLSACVDGTTYPPPGFVCAGGAFTACEQAGAAAECAFCGCPSGQSCILYESCQPLRGLGEPCFQGVDCVSGNCSEPFGTDASQPGRCLVGRDQACTADDCLSCDVTVQGDRCAQTCDRVSQCTGGSCIFYEHMSPGFCRLGCSSANPCPDLWSCLVTSDGSTTYCEPPVRCDPDAQVPCGLFGTCDPQYHVCR